MSRFCGQSIFFSSRKSIMVKWLPSSPFCICWLALELNASKQASKEAVKLSLLFFLQWPQCHLQQQMEAEEAWSQPWPQWPRSPAAVVLVFLSILSQDKWSLLWLQVLQVTAIAMDLAGLEPKAKAKNEEAWAKFFNEVVPLRECWALCQNNKVSLLLHLARLLLKKMKSIRLDLPTSLRIK